MSYKVKGAAAVVELDDRGGEELGTGTRVYLEHGVVVPSNAKKAHIEHLLAVDLIEEVKSSGSDGDQSDAKATPRKSSGS